MRVFKDLQSIAEDAKDAIVIIGNFDGVHKGHQALIHQGAMLAIEQGKKLAVLTFEPHPRKLFRPDEPPTRITPLSLKEICLKANGVDILYALEFDWDFASQSPEMFIAEILQQGLGAAHIVIGDDFHFGQMRKGTPDLIKEMGVPTTIVEKIATDKGEIYSSSLIRAALRQGDIKTANEMLGWQWEIRGEVIKGDQRGRELGYPTANVPLGETVHPAYGVYATLTRIEGEEKWHMSATNIGIRPMFEIPTAQVETFIFDFDRDIYGKTLHIRPVQRLRSEAKFDSLDALIRQMAEDCDKARDVLKGAF